MARYELRQLGITETATSYLEAWKNTNAECGVQHPLRSLDVARRFIKDQAGDCSGILVNLGILHILLRVPPSALALVTDPETAADLLRHEDFDSLSSDHPTYQAFKPYVGDFIVFKYQKDAWLEDRRAAALPYSQQRVDRTQSIQIAQEALKSAMCLATAEGLPHNWIKYLTSYQVVRHSTDLIADPEILSGAVDAHSTYTSRTVREVFIGAFPRPVGKVISYPTLCPYHRLKHEIAAKIPSGRLKAVLENLPEERRDVADVSAALIGGLSTLKSFMANILYVLATNPELQDEAVRNPSLQRRIMYETARRYPAAPYILRKTTRAIELGDSIIPKDALVVFGIFAYGTNPKIENADTFDPFREGLEEMFTTQSGAANVFSAGPRACLGRYIGAEILEETTRAVLEKYEVRCLNKPVVVIGKGIGSSFDQPVQFQLVDRSTNQHISATFS